MPRPIRLSLWIDGIWFTLLAAYILAGAAIVPFHGDESTQIFMGRDFYYLFREGDLAKVLYDSAWTSGQDEQHLRLINGTVTKTIHGFLAARAGMSRDEINGHWDWALDYAANRDMGKLPEAQLLRSARLASAAQLALAGAALFALVRMTIGGPEAAVASALFALHPALLLNGRRAMMEGSHLLGMMLVLLAGAWLLRERRWWKFALLGVASGFAVAAKHPNVFVAALVFLACGSLWLYQAARAKGQARQREMRSLFGLLLAGAIALPVFYLLNPAWWQAPLESAAEVLRLRVDLLEEQAALYGGYDSWAARIEGFLEYAFFSQSQYYEVAEWAGYTEISRQISSYEASGWSGFALGGSVGGLLGLALTVFGAAHMLSRRSKVRGEYRWLLLLWGGGIALITLLVTPLPWQRYYLPALPFAQLAAACALVHLIRLLWNRVESRAHHERSQSD